MAEYIATTGQVRRYWQYGANAWMAGVADDRDDGPDGSHGAEFDRWLAAHDREVRAEALREAAEWLLATGYPTDWSTDAAVPDALWSACIDVAHRDADGYMHGNMLTRDEVDDWLSMEAGRPAPEGGADRG